MSTPAATLADISSNSPTRWLPRCPFRIILEGREAECTRRGEHDVHRYFAPRTGMQYEVEFVDLEAS
jgi:hypothetical protein